MAEPKDAKNESGTGPVPEPLRIPLGDAGVAEPYSIFTRKEKWFIVGMVAVAGFYRCVVKLQGGEWSRD
ncbi:major facilitator superfamily [Colletotrichum kahawae]|uniref:Major facilitator superfamily n=1 Tax=Colletotrichum kahawae TaxID=34407 RepID=A0AAD9Y892_COLKA|nr:major facilitator superfamily [Colletotrichum kahawae]